MTKTRDRRFTVSVDADLADKLDEYVSKIPDASRSGVVEQALRLWATLSEFPDKDKVLEEAIRLYEKQQERELYRSYYSELSEAAKAEDKDWSELSEQSANKTWPARKD